MTTLSLELVRLSQRCGWRWFHTAPANQATSVFEDKVNAALTSRPDNRIFRVRTSARELRTDASDPWTYTDNDILRSRDIEDLPKIDSILTEDPAKSVMSLERFAQDRLDKKIRAWRRA